MASREASHDRLVALLRQEGYTAGDVLPTEPLLAEKLNMSRQSVRETLAGLQALGVVQVRQVSRRRLVGFDPGAFGRNLGLTLPFTAESLEELLAAPAYAVGRIAGIADRPFGRQAGEVIVPIFQRAPDPRADMVEDIGMAAVPGQHVAVEVAGICDG